MTGFRMGKGAAPAALVQILTDLEPAGNSRYSWGRAELFGIVSRPDGVNGRLTGRADHSAFPKSSSISMQPSGPALGRPEGGDV
jgi:hypothetical protein